MVSSLLPIFGCLTVLVLVYLCLGNSFLSSQPNARTGVTVVQESGALGSPTRADLELARWGAGLQSNNAGFRARACEELAKLGSRALKYTDVLTRLSTADPDVQVKVAAASAMWAIGGSAGPTFKTLNGWLRGQDPELKGAAAKALGTIGEHASPFVDAIGALCLDNDVNVRRRAAESLANMGLHAEPAAANLNILLHDKDADVRGAAAEALSHIGPGAAAFTENIVKLLQDSAEHVRWVAAQALGQLGEVSIQHCDAVVAFFADKDPAVRVAAVQAIGHMGEHASLHLDATVGLQYLLQDNNPQVRRAAKWALQELGAQADPSVKHTADANGVVPTGGPVALFTPPPDEELPEVAIVVCNDTNVKECPEWADNDRCKEDIVRAACRLSCQLCPSCYDESEECASFQKQGLCEKNPKRMHVHCKQSCNVCKDESKLWEGISGPNVNIPAGGETDSTGFSLFPQRRKGVDEPD